MQARRSEVSESYARALVELADEKGKLEQVHADVDAIASLLQNNQKLTQLLFNPVVEGDKKRAVLAKIGKEAGFNQYTNNFLNLLVEKDRLGLLEEICQEFEELYCKLTDTQVGRQQEDPPPVRGKFAWGVSSSSRCSSFIGSPHRTAELLHCYIGLGKWIIGFL